MSANPKPAQGPDRARIIGFSTLALIVVLVAFWLQTEGKAAVRARPTVTHAEITSRFDTNPWKSPDEPLLGFVRIPAGSFTMGSDPAVDGSAYENERWSSESRQGSVDVPEFYIGRFEVTIAQFAAFVRATNRAVSEQTLRGEGDLPVANVTWADAIGYARWLEAELRSSPQSPTEIKQLLNDGWRITLPNEAQWEKAARGNDGRIYPWGHTVDASRANFGRSGARPVGSFDCDACAFGLADMSGNVWELTRSPFQSYPWSPSDEPRDPKADALFVMRGGAFNDPPANVRAATRGGIDPGVRRPFIGFRLVLEET